MLRYLIIIFCILFISQVNFAQRNKKEVVKVVDASAKRDTTPKDKSAKSEGPKPYKTVIDSSAVSQYGLITVHRVKEKWYFEISDSILNRQGIPRLLLAEVYTVAKK